jgi:hypothetical protein
MLSFELIPTDASIYRKLVSDIQQLIQWSSSYERSINIVIVIVGARTNFLKNFPSKFSQLSRLEFFHANYKAL